MFSILLPLSLRQRIASISHSMAREEDSGPVVKFFWSRMK